MADWQFHVDLGDVWQNDEFPLFIKAEVVACRFQELLPTIRSRGTETYLDLANELENDIIVRFKEYAESKNNDVEEFDGNLEILYDWADTPLDNNWGGKKLCWVNTFR